MLDVGDRAPSFVGQASDGRTVTLLDLRGKWVVLYFYPRAFTPGCTSEAKRFRDNYDDLCALGAEVVGVSTDRLERQCKFASANAIKFPLVADDSKQISRAYGVLRSLLPVDKRVTFIIDPEGVIQAVFQHEFQVLRHFDDVHKFLVARASAEGVP